MWNLRYENKISSLSYSVLIVFIHACFKVMRKVLITKSIHSEVPMFVQCNIVSLKAGAATGRVLQKSCS